eukprot:7057252-Pyramimonas_sp.AAC.1
MPPLPFSPSVPAFLPSEAILCSGWLTPFSRSHFPRFPDNTLIFSRSLSPVRAAARAHGGRQC